MKVISHREAKERGLMFYFTNKPCKRSGHISIRVTSSGWCRECSIESNAKWHATHRDQENRRMRRRYYANRRREITKAKEYDAAARQVAFCVDLRCFGNRV